MRFDILGPLRVGDHDGEHAVTAGRDRAVLALLLLHPGRVVAAEDLIDAVWEAAPPVTARGQLQTCVSRLRRSLPGVTIVTDPAGYRLDVGPDDLDAVVFTRLVGEARRLSTVAPDDACRLFREALGLWRGAALPGFDAPTVRRGAAVLDEQRALATEDWIGLELAGGRERDLLAELAGLVEQFPLRERLRAHLMMALFLVGRQADALAEFQRARAVLREELGVEPGAALRDMRQRILTGAETGGSASPVTRPATPLRCLPRTVGDFTGRADIVARLTTDVGPEDSSGPAVHVIDGMAGSGKTTLALHVAGLVGARYPDAQLYLDLHGHSERRPLEPAAALTTLLRQLGVEADRIPADLDERITLWRNELATRQALIVLDNAAGTGQVIPLLPAGPGCLVLITSRRRLIGLDGVRVESLQVMAESEAVALLTRIAGQRVLAEPAAAGEVVRRCGRLPLAIRLAGARLAHRPHWRVADLLERLQDAVLPGLVAEDRTLADAFAVSYRQLDEPARRLFRLIGLHPGGRFDVLAVAALADLRVDDARDLLDDMVDAHLIEEPEPGYHRLHDLMREYAATLAAAEPADVAVAAIGRLLDFLTHAFLSANSVTQRSDVVAALGLGQPLRPDLVAAVGDPVAYLEHERPHLAALVEAAITVGHTRQAWSLPRVVWRHLWSRGYIDDIAQLQGRALHVARREGERAAVAMSANYLASAYCRFNEYERATELLEESIAVYRGIGDVDGEGTALTNLGVVYEAMGRIGENVELCRQALRMPHRTSSGVRLNSLALALAQLGCYEEALWFHRRRLLLAIEERDVLAIGICLLHAATVKVRLSDAAVPVAWRMLRAALRLHRITGHRIGEAEVVNELGLLHRREQRYAEALDAHRLALDMANQINDRRYRSVFLNDLGITTLRTGDATGAAADHQRALQIATAIHHPFEQARAHAGLADCLIDTDSPRAERHGEQALAIFRRMGVPERLEAERWLLRARRHVPRQLRGRTVDAGERQPAARGEDQLREVAAGGTMER